MSFSSILDAGVRPFPSRSSFPAYKDGLLPYGRATTSTNLSNHLSSVAFLDYTLSNIKKFVMTRYFHLHSCHAWRKGIRHLNCKAVESDLSVFPCDEPYSFDCGFHDLKVNDFFAWNKFEERASLLLSDRNVRFP